MNNRKRLSTPQRILRLLGWMLFGGIVGGVIGTYISYFKDSGWPDFLTLDLLLSFTRTGVILFGILATIFLLQARKYHTQFQQAGEADDDLVDKLYSKTFRYLEYASILYNLASSLLLFNVLVGVNFYYNSEEAGLIFPLFDYSFFIILIIAQALLMKTIQKIRNYKLSAFPTCNEIKEYMYSLDEGEKQANFEQAFLTQFNLNQRLLPCLYLVICIIEMLTQTKQLLASVVVLTIHLYINLMQYKMVRRYFK